MVNELFLKEFIRKNQRVFGNSKRFIIKKVHLFKSCQTFCTQLEHSKEILEKLFMLIIISMLIERNLIHIIELIR